MKTFLVVLISLSMGLQVLAEEVNEAKGMNKSADSLKLSLVDHFVTAFDREIQKEIKNYNKNRLMPELFAKTAAQLDPKDGAFLMDLRQQNIKLVMPEMFFAKGVWHSTIQGVKVGFNMENLLKGQILIAGKVFEINSKKSLKEIEAELETFLKVQKIVTNKNAAMDFVLSMLGISRAEAVGILVVVAAILLLVAAVGVSFYLKNKTAKLAAVKEALKKADEDMKAKAEDCQSARTSDTSYDSTFDLMGSILKNKTEKSAAGAFYSTMLKEDGGGSGQGQNADCKTMVDGFINKTLGSEGSVAGAGSDLAILRTKLCGGTANEIALSGGEERPGSYVLLKNCMYIFHRTHENVTDRNRENMWIDSDTNLIKNRNYFNGSIGH